MVTILRLVVLKKLGCRPCFFAAKTRLHEHFHRLRLALARSPSLALAATAPIRAQNDALRPASAFVLGLGAGGFRFDPVSRLYFSRPLAVSPAPLDAGSFSPRPTANETDFFLSATLRPHPACSYTGGRIPTSAFLVNAPFAVRHRERERHRDGVRSVG